MSDESVMPLPQWCYERRETLREQPDEFKPDPDLERALELEALHRRELEDEAA